jgi:hypothetical protein
MPFAPGVLSRGFAAGRFVDEKKVAPRSPDVA